MTLFKYQREQCIVMEPAYDIHGLVQHLLDSRDDVVRNAYFLATMEELEFMRGGQASRADPFMAGNYADGTGMVFLFFDRKMNNVWYGGDTLGYILWVSDDEMFPLLWEVDSYQEEVTPELTTTGIKITKADGVDDSWQHEPDYIYHKFYPIIQGYPVLIMQLLNWFGTGWQKLLEESP